jgi:putative DNA primase/helicase
MNNFYDFIRQHGYEPKNEIVPDKFIRFGKKNSVSAKLYANGQVGYLHDWKTGEKHYWFANDTKSLSHQERQERQKEIERIKQSQDERQALIHKQVGIQAKELYMAASDALECHPYLVRKKVKPHGIRQQGGNLLIPVCSVQGDYQSIQFINESGDKRFLKGGKTKGGCHFIGLLKMDSPVFIAEGYATAVSIYEDTKCLTIVAFNASNLVPVAVELKKHLPNIQIVIAGDSDAVGRTYAIKAAQLVNGSTLIPDFGDNPYGFSDWNDYFNPEVNV